MGSERRDALDSTSLCGPLGPEESMARSKNKQKVKRHAHKIRRKRRLARKKAAKDAQA